MDYWATDYLQAKTAMWEGTDTRLPAAAFTTTQNRVQKALDRKQPQEVRAPANSMFRQMIAHGHETALSPSGHAVQEDVFSRGSKGDASNTEQLSAPGIDRDMRKIILEDRPKKHESGGETVYRGLGIRHIADAKGKTNHLLPDAADPRFADRRKEFVQMLQEAHKDPSKLLAWKGKPFDFDTAAFDKQVGLATGKLTPQLAALVASDRYRLDHHPGMPVGDPTYPDKRNRLKIAPYLKPRNA